MADPLTLTDRERCELVSRQIQQLLREHDLVAFYALSARQHGVHNLHVDASWCRLLLPENEDGSVSEVRFRSKLAEYIARGLSEDDAKRAQLQDIEGTTGTVEFMLDVMRPTARLLDFARALIRSHFEVEHSDTRVGPHSGQGH